jgi:protocatechuate 3,4-dioxygenase beta subunit
MRLSLVLLASVCFAQSGAEKAALTGSVSSAATGAPLKKASVWLEEFSPERGVNGARSVSLPATTTDAEGRFTLSGIEPGSYLLLAQRVGYLDQGFGAPVPQIVGPPLVLKAGETRRGVKLELTPQSLLFGKVMDEDGDPVPGAQVQVLRASFAGGRRHLVEAGAGTAQDDGSFVIGNLTPGRYFLSANLRFMDSPAGRERPTPTYFPSSTTESSASPIDVVAGAEVRDLAIRLRKARVYSIRGRALTPDGHPAQVALLLDDARSVSTGSDGRFEFEAVLPGAHEIRTNSTVAVFASERAPATLVGRADVAVTDSDLHDVTVPVGPGATVKGLIRGAKTGRVAIGEDAVPVKQDGSFVLHHLLPAIHAVEVTGLPEGSYVKGVSFAGREVYDWQIDLSSGAGGELVIEVSPNAGEVSGLVPNAPGALVQIWPAGGDSAKSVKTDGVGAFRIHSLPPGDYLLVAFQHLDDDLAQYAPFRAAFESQAAKVTVGERGRERVELKLIEREAISAEAAKLR